MEQLTVEQIALISVIVSIIVSGYKIFVNIGNGGRITYNKKYVVAVIYALCGVLTYIFKPDAFPALPVVAAGADAVAYMMAYLRYGADFLGAILAQFGFVTVLYTYITGAIEKRMSEPIALG